MSILKPKFVYINWSESTAFEESGMYNFEQFERIAETVGAKHNTGGYLKTKITVIFKCGDTYQARVDLNTSCLGFEHHIKQCRETFERVSNDKSISANELYFKNMTELNKTWEKIKFNEGVN